MLSYLNNASETSSDSESEYEHEQTNKQVTPNKHEAPKKELTSLKKIDEKIEKKDETKPSPPHKLEPSTPSTPKPEEPSNVDYMITGDLKERFFSDDDADNEIAKEIRDSNLTKEKCIENADYLCRYLKVKVSEEPTMLVIEELKFIIQQWNQKGKLCLEHDLKKPEIRKNFVVFLEMIFANLARIQYNVIIKMKGLLEVMGEKKGVFCFDAKMIEGMQGKLGERMQEIERQFTEDSKQNIKNRKRRKRIRKEKRKNIRRQFG